MRSVSGVHCSSVEGYGTTEKEGYEIEAVRNRDTALTEAALLSGAEIESSIKSEWAGRRVVYFEETDSTNLRAKEAGKEGRSSQGACMWQTARFPEKAGEEEAGSRLQEPVFT